MAALRWMMQTKGIPAGQRKGSGCVKSQTYQGAATKYEQPSVSQAGHAESASEAGCWLKTVRSEESLCS